MHLEAKNNTAEVDKQLSPLPRQFRRTSETQQWGAQPRDPIDVDEVEQRHKGQEGRDESNTAWRDWYNRMLSTTLFDNINDDCD